MLLDMALVTWIAEPAAAIAVFMFAHLRRPDLHVHVAIAASPRLVPEEYPSRGRGVAAIHRRNIHVAVAASRRRFGFHPDRITPWAAA